MSCLICHKSEETTRNFLLTCHDCNRTWHHRCHLPQIPDEQVVNLFNAFLKSQTQRRPEWRCGKCSRKKANICVARPQSPSEILVVDPEETVRTPHVPESRPSKPTAVSEIIDLTESPEVHRPKRAQTSGAQEIIDLLDPPRTSTPSHTTEIIDISDSPEFVTVQLLEPPAPSPPLEVHNVAVDLPSMDVDVPSSPRQSLVASPTLSELDLPRTPGRAGTQTPNNVVIPFPAMEVDDIDQKPLLLQNLASSGHSVPPQGGSLGPAWMRERYDATGQMALWQRYVEKQNRLKPLSSRKPARTRSPGSYREPFVVFPFVQIMNT
ncbi:hypothetical protein DFH09DRAFT_108131 [Mycena vulgaris]|nr:hypothetical protein DFH09DRAFT_108131 [Mycena vulgaris]